MAARDAPSYQRERLVIARYLIGQARPMGHLGQDPRVLPARPWLVCLLPPDWHAGRVETRLTPIVLPTAPRAILRCNSSLRIEHLTNCPFTTGEASRKERWAGPLAARDRRQHGGCHSQVQNKVGLALSRCLGRFKSGTHPSRPLPLSRVASPHRRTRQASITPPISPEPNGIVEGKSSLCLIGLTPPWLDRTGQWQS